MYDSQGHQIKVISNYVAQGTTKPKDWIWDVNDNRWEDGAENAIDRDANFDQNVISETVYDDQGRVESTRNAQGNVTQYVYDTGGRRVRIVGNYVPQGAPVVDPSAWIWDANDGQWEYGINPVSHGTNNDQNQISDTTYDLAGRVASTRDVVGKVTRFVYDALGRRVRTIANFNSATDPANWIWQNNRWEDGSGNAISHGAAFDQNLISDTTYNKAGQVEWTRDVRGTKTKFVYDTAGRRIQVSPAADTSLETISYTCYNKAGQVLRTIDNWIAAGEDSPDEQYENGTWKFAPEHNGPANDQNRIVSYDYDAAGHKTTVIDPLGNAIATTYRLDGRVDTVTDPENMVSLYRYDNRGRRILVVQGYASNGEDPALWAWDNVQKLWEKSNGTTPIDHNTPVNDQNVIVQVHYDPAGRMLNRRDPRGNLTTYEYDKLGRRTTLNMPKTDSEILTWTTSYTEQAGLPRTILTDPMGYETERRVDRLGRLNEINYLEESSKLTPDVAFSYDGAGNRALMTEYGDAAHTDETRITHYGYNDARRLTQVDFDTDGDGTIDDTVNYEYDAGGLRTKLMMPGDLHVTYTYDTKGRLIQLTDWDGHETRFAYDSASRMVSTKRHNGFRSRYGYDAAGHLRRLHHTKDAKTFAHFEYEVDGRGNRIRALEAPAHPATTNETTYLYHDKSLILRGDWLPLDPFQVATRRSATLQLSFFGSYATLTMGTGPDHSIFDIYVNHALWRSFDSYAAAAGEREIEILLESDGPHTLEIRNRAEKHLDSTGYKLRFKQLVVPDCTYDLHTIEYAYDALSRVTEARYNPGLNTAVENADLLRRYQYGYDLAGNRTEELIWENGVQTDNNAYTYNAANQITNTGFVYNANGNLTNNGANAYVWDRANRLLSMGGSLYGYDGLGNRTQQTVNSIVTDYLLDVQPGLVKVLAATTGNDTQRYVFGPRGILSYENPLGEWGAVAQDGLGSVRVEVDDDLNVVASRNLDPIGVEWGTQGSFGLPHSFTGEMQDTNDLLYLRARYYAPEIGVFTALDPMELVNRYQYGGGNVINTVDPSGMIAETPSAWDTCQQPRNCDCYLDPNIVTLCQQGSLPVCEQRIRFQSPGLSCCDNSHITPTNVTIAPCPDGPPRLFDYEKTCQGLDYENERDSCGVQIYHRVANHYGQNGCLTWVQVVAMIIRTELGFIFDSYGTFHPNQQYMEEKTREAVGRLISQRVFNCNHGPVFGFICLLATIETWYRHSGSLESKFGGYEAYEGIAREILDTYSLGFEKDHPATWENIINGTLQTLRAAGLDQEHLEVAEGPEARALRQPQGFYPISAHYDPASSYADEEGYVYITIKYQGSSGMDLIRSGSCIG